MNHFMQRAVVLLAEEVSGKVFSDESATPQTRGRTFNVVTGEYTYLLLDLAVRIDGSLVCIEANGSNAAGSSANGGDVPRAEHMVATLLARGLEGNVAVIAYQRGTPCQPELALRSALFAEELERRSGRIVAYGPPGTVPQSDRYNVIVGSIDHVQDMLTVNDGQLRYLGTPVTFASNSNLQPALIRLGYSEPNPLVFHEGNATRVVLDKRIQQECCVGTGLTPLSATEVDSVDELVRFLDANRNDAWVVKMKSGSGASGVVPVPPKVSLDRARLLMDKSLADADHKYGGLETAFPLQAFEFAHTMPLWINDQPFQWDLRVEVVVEPETIRATPLSARRCPSPFDGSYDPETVIVNLTGKGDGNRRVLSPCTLAVGIGVDPDWLTDEVCLAAARWAARSVSCSD